MIVYCESCSKNVTATRKRANHYCSECNTKCEVEIDCALETKSAEINEKIDEPASKRTEVSLTSIEVYELILFGWLKKLKKLGLSSTFRNCVRELWEKYRSRILKKNENGQIEMVLTPNFAKRDLEIMIGKNYKRKKRVRSLPNKKLKKSTETNVKLENTVNGDVDSDEGNENEDENQDQDQDQDDEDLMQPTTYLKTSTTFTQGVLRMTKHKLFSFLCLGLILTREKFLLAELKMAISNGTIPFQDVRSFLPSNEARDIIYAYMLYHEFRYTHAKISLMTRRLMQFIGMDNITETEGLDVSDILERFVKIYHLPKKIIGYIMKLLKLIPPVREQLPGILWTKSREIFGFALVIFMLKLLFFLDDYHEYVLDAFAEKYDREFFSFVKWTKFLKFRRAFFDQYPKFKECNERDERLCEYFFWQTNDDEDFDLDTFFSNQDIDCCNDDVVLEAPEFKSFEDLSLNYLIDPEKYEQEFEDVSLSKPYKRKITPIRNVEDLKGGPKPITELVPKYMPFDHVSTKKGLRALVNNYLEKNSKKKMNPAFNRNFHISKVEMRKRTKGRKRRKKKNDNDAIETTDQPKFKKIFNSKNYWFNSLDFHRKRVIFSSDEFNESKLPTFPKSFAFLLTEFAKFAQCNPSYIFLYFQKIELKFVDFEVKPDDNSCKANYLRYVLHRMW